MTEYLKYCLEGLNRNLIRNDLDENIKSDISCRIRTIEDLLERFSFLEKKPEEKQAIRIEWLGSLKKRGIDISAKLATLALYDEINSFFPYLKIRNRNGVHKDFEDLLNKELQLIDFGIIQYGTNHISENEFNLAFEKFYDSLGGLLVHELRAKADKLKKAFEMVYTLNSKNEKLN